MKLYWCHELPEVTFKLKYNLLNLYTIGEVLEILENRYSLYNFNKYKEPKCDFYYIYFGCEKWVFDSEEISPHYWNMNLDCNFLTINKFIAILTEAKWLYGKNMPLYKVPYFELDGGL